jgi:PAS domain S-box-containing protein
MLFHFPTFALVFFLGGLMALFYAAVVFLKRPVPGADTFAFFALTIAVWLIFRALEAGAMDITDKIMWGKMMYFGASLSGPAWLVFVLDYSGIKHWRSSVQRLWLFLVPLFSWIMIWTNDQWGMYWPNIYVSPGTAGTILVWEHGWAFWVEAVYNYLMLGVGIYLIGRFLFRNQGIFRWQAIVVLLGSLIPIFANLVYLSGFSPVKGLDLTPFAFAVAGVIFAVTIFRFHLLDVVPVARNTLVEKIPDGIVVLDNQQTIIDINPAAEMIIPVERKKSIGSSLAQIWPQMHQSLNENVKKGNNAGFELALADKCLETSITTIQDSKQKTVGRLLLVRDVTGHRRMEQSLQESQTRYATLVEQSNEGVLIVQKGLIKFANQTVSDICGYELDEIRDHSLLMLIADEDRALVEERYEKRQTGLAVPNIYEVQVERKDGGLRTIELSVGTILFEGTAAHIVSARDITERKLTQRRLEKLYEEEKHLRNSLEEEMTKRSKYTRALVHELNTPLTSILASGELLESEIHDPILMALVKNIRLASYNLKQRIDELIELARGETGILKINVMPVDLTSLWREIESEMRPLAAKKGLALKVEQGANLPLVMADRVRLKQVLVNLISNAVKFTAVGRIDVIVELKAEFVEVSVRDTGRGISSQELENLFDPYRRKVNEGQQLGGLGIGLTLSKMYVELQGGKIEVESEAGKGSTFRFTLPVLARQ